MIGDRQTILNIKNKRSRRTRHLTAKQASRQAWQRVRNGETQVDVWRFFALAACCLLTVSLQPVSYAADPVATPAGASDSVSHSDAMPARIDDLLEQHRREIGWRATEPASDAAFIRRAHLDLTGTPPTASEVLTFLDDDSSEKDRRLIDRLLASPTSASHFGGQWARWMLPEDADPFLQNGRIGLESWLRDRFAENLRYDRLVSDLLVASGSAQNGPAAFFVALEGKPEKIAAKTARVFMGVQLDCAECHDHPFDEWTQEDFWGFAAYFAQLSTGGQPAMMGNAEVSDLDEGEVMLPGSEEVIKPTPLVKTGLTGAGTRRQQLTIWLTTRENPFLARATVNRVWSLMFGRGLIEPIDDMRSIEMASHPALLSELSDYFAATQYDLRNLIATITKTKAYRLSSVHPSGIVPEASYATMANKPLTEQQMSNALAKVARQVVGDGNDAAQTALASQLGKLRGDASEAKLGIVSALVTLHGNAFDTVTRDESSRLLKALEAPYMDQRKQLRWLFLTTLGRPPTTDEQIAFSERIGQASVAQSTEDAVNDDESKPGHGRQWQSDLLWALVNSTEFAMTP